MAIFGLSWFLIIYKVIVGINMLNQPDYKYKPIFGNTVQPQQQFQAAMPVAGSPAMQAGLDAEAIKEKAQDSYVANRAGEFEEIDPLKLWAVGLPAWYVTAQGMDLFAKASRGTDYSKTIQGKIGKFGDKVSDIITENKVAKSGPMQTLGRWVKSAKNWVVKQAFDHSAILRGMKTPTSPELEFVKSQAKGMRGFILYDYPQVAENFIDRSIHSVKDLDMFGADKAFIDAKQALINGGSSAKEVIERAQFELLSKNKSPEIIDRFMKLSPERRAEALKNMKARALGYNNLKHFNSVKDDIINNIDDVIKACDKANPNMYSKVWTSDKNWWTKFKGHIMGRRVYMSEFRNKLISAIGKMPDGTPTQKTKLGRFLPKLTNYFLEGATNRVAGGKFVALMNATLLADVIIRTATADKGDKFQTFTERLAEMVGFFIFSPIALKLVHIFGGAQYAGISEKTFVNLLKKLDAKKAKMSVESYNAAKEVILKAQNAAKSGKNMTEAYREAFKFFNDKATAAKYASKGEYKAAKKALSGILKGDTWNPITKLVKKLARIVTVGIEQPAAYRTKALHLEPKFGFKKVGQMLLDAFKHPKYWLKQGLGYPVRIIAVMMMVMPFLNNLGVKFTHMIFGRPSKSILDKESDKPAENPNGMTPQQQAELEKYIADLKHQQAVNNMVKPDLSRPTNLINMATNGHPYVEQPTPQAKPDLSRPTNLLNMASHGQMYENKLTPKPVEQPEQKEEKKKDEELEPVRTYVPSSAPVNLAGVKEDTSAVDAALKKSDAVERQAMETLSMKW